MPTEPHDLLARGSLGDLERMAVRRAPDGLHHVPEVEASEPELRVAISNDHGERNDPDRHAAPHHERPGAVPRRRQERRALDGRRGRSHGSAHAMTFLKTSTPPFS